MTSIFETISRTRIGQPDAVTGWCTDKKALALAALVLSIRPECTVEIGVFGGSSLLPLALAHQEIGRGTVIGIDPWSTAIASQEQPNAEHREWWAKVDMQHIYENFMALIARHHLEPFTRIIRNTSNNVTPPNSIGVLHVDGSHVETAITDVSRFAPKVYPGGFCVMDDAVQGSGHGPSPIVASNRLIGMGFVKRYEIDTSAFFQRVR